MTPLPSSLDVHPDRGMVGFRDSQVDVFDEPGAGEPRAAVVSNGFVTYLGTDSKLDVVSLRFAAAPEPRLTLGSVSVEPPTGEVVISEITRGVHGPYVVPERAGSYRLTASSEASAPTTGWLELERLGEPTPDDED
ncbi:hypothetical protein [Amycolatopsis sp. NPDC051903]|uniref:hypothetical protein n=1 Tax=Amycolatopsis sp. NPDC051903 TaxID=3363936 RepID=UPI0037B2E67C